MDGLFPQSVIQAAQSAQRAYVEIFASVALAQWADESAYGQHMPFGSNNPFGIKAIPGTPFVTAMTHETLHGRYVRIPQHFAAFPSLEAAFLAHAKLLATSGYYIKARHDKNPKQFAFDLEPHYATGIPGHPYSEIIIGLMNAHDLYQYDV